MPTSSTVQITSRTCINVNDKYDIAHWTARLGVSEQQLRDAVSKVGTVISDLEVETRALTWCAAPRNGQKNPPDPRPELKDRSLNVRYARAGWG